MAKRRIDRILVEQGLAASREKARVLVMEGQVRVGESRVVKPSTLVGEGATITLQATPAYVGRGGDKLAHALEHFDLDVQRAVALDVGASTGGFTDCMLKHGARRVYALDVGHGQLDYGLRSDPRVVVMERVNARYPFSLPEDVDLATVDVSFISATKVVPNAIRWVREGGFLVVLIKPQFEAGPREVRRGGVVRDAAVHGLVLARVISWAIEQGLRVRDLTPSPLLGPAGNREFFVLLQKETG